MQVVGVVLITQFGSSAVQPSSPSHPPAPELPPTGAQVPSDSQVVDMTVAVQKQGSDQSMAGRRHVLQIKSSRS
jgi:hypothetical protein